MLGILGGMGPLATSHFYRVLIEHTSAGSDQEHVPVVVWSDPRVPDRTAALLGEGPSPIPALLDGLRWLEHAGANCIVVPCNTAHAYLPELARHTNVEILDMIALTMRQIRRQIPSIGQIGVLSTRGTRAARLYENAGHSVGLEVLHLPDDEQERLVDPAIHAVKAGADLGMARIRIVEAVQRLRDIGAQIAVPACTELSILMDPRDQALPTIDPLATLADCALSWLRGDGSWEED